MDPDRVEPDGGVRGFASSRITYAFLSLSVWVGCIRTDGTKRNRANEAAAAAREHDVFCVFIFWLRFAGLHELPRSEEGGWPGHGVDRKKEDRNEREDMGRNCTQIAGQMVILFTKLLISCDLIYFSRSYFIHEKSLLVEIVTALQ